MSRQNFLITLYSNGLLTSREVSNLLESCKRLKESPVRILRSLRFFASEDLQLFLNKFCFVPMITAEVIENLKDELKFFLPQDLAQVYSCFAFAKVKNTLHVAAEDPLDRGLHSYLRFFTNCEIVLYSASVDQLSKGLRRLYQLEQNSLKIFTLLDPDWFSQVHNPSKIAGDEDSENEFSLDSFVFQAKSGTQEGFDPSSLDFDLGLLKKLIGDVETKGKANFPKADSKQALHLNSRSTSKNTPGQQQLFLDRIKTTQNLFEEEEMSPVMELPLGGLPDSAREQNPSGVQDTFLSAEVLSSIKADLVGDLADFEIETKESFVDLTTSENSQEEDSEKVEQNNFMDSSEFLSQNSENSKTKNLEAENMEAEIGAADLNEAEFSAGIELGLADDEMFGKTPLITESETMSETQENAFSALDDGISAPRFVRSTIQNLSKILVLKSLGMREFDARLEFCNQKLKDVGLELVPESTRICKLKSREILVEEDRQNLIQDLLPTLRRMFGDVKF